MRVCVCECVCVCVCKNWIKLFIVKNASKKKP